MTRPQIENRISVGSALTLLVLIVGLAGSYYQNLAIQDDIMQSLELQLTEQQGEMRVVRTEMRIIKGEMSAAASQNSARIANVERAVNGELGHIRRALDRIIARLDRLDEFRREPPNRNAITGDPR